MLLCLSLFLIVQGHPLASSSVTCGVPLLNLSRLLGMLLINSLKGQECFNYWKFLNICIDHLGSSIGINLHIFITKRRCILSDIQSQLRQDPLNLQLQGQDQGAVLESLDSSLSLMRRQSKMSWISYRV